MGSVLAAAWPAAAGEPASAAGDSALRDLLLKRASPQGAPAMVALRVDQESTRITASGRSEVGGPEVRGDTLFEWGSLTKTFTALLLADAVQRGECRLDDAAEALLPDGIRLRDTRGEPLRLVDLATHRSGLPRLPGNLLPRDPPDPYADYGVDSLMLFLRGWKPARPRDAAYEYSNLGFGLLGELLGRRAGRSYAELLAERVLRPLGIKDAHLAVTPARAERMANGHGADGKPAAHWHFGVLAGAGALVGSAEALARYAQAALGLFPHPLERAFALCFERRAETSAPLNPIGLAWQLAPLDGRTLLTHSGETAGFAATLWLDPQRRSAAAVLANAAVAVQDLALHVLDPVVPPQDFAAAQRPAATLSAEALKPLSGSYRMTPQFALVIRAREGRLFAQATGQGEFELFAETPRRFFARVTPLQVAFDGDAGPPPALTLTQNGANLRFVREPEPAVR